MPHDDLISYSIKTNIKHKTIIHNITNDERLQIYNLLMTHTRVKHAENIVNKVSPEIKSTTQTRGQSMIVD